MVSSLILKQHKETSPRRFHSLHPSIFLFVHYLSVQFSKILLYIIKFLIVMISRKIEIPLTPLPWPSHKSTTQASFEEAKAYKDGNWTYKGSSLHLLSFQNFTLCSFPTIKDNIMLKVSQFFLKAFHNPTPYPSLTS